MTLTELKYIVAVAREKHSGKAADACYVSQPTLSVAIKKLEEELEVKLFERSASEVTVTPLGEEIVRQAVAGRTSQFRPGPLEGVLVRHEDADWLQARVKLVRADFTQAIDSHWRSRALEWNQLDRNPVPPSAIPQEPQP